jgi:ArsR family metal-binding transcriptional regulator
MLINDYVLDIFTPPCNPNSVVYAAKALLTVDLTEVLPYLNATLDDPIYNPSVEALTWKTQKRGVVFRGKSIAISNLEDRTEAHQIANEMIALVNDTWERRAEIEPSYHVKQRPTPLMIYKLLPQTNCRECGDPTCYVFATKLSAGQHQLTDCPVLQESDYAHNLQELQALVLG